MTTCCCDNPELNPDFAKTRRYGRTGMTAIPSPWRRFADELVVAPFVRQHRLRVLRSCLLAQTLRSGAQPDGADDE